ncbi:MAG: hypothetical protein IT353_22550 [Gemmatimonadaceae bacterium]|nr:hypothetical protein [Gemmatimonadaceae bacterium]
MTLVSEKEPKRVVGDFPASERYFNGQNDYPRPLGRVTSVAATLTHVYVSTGDSGTISTYALSSAQKSFVTLPADVKKVTGKNVDDFVVAELDKRGTGDRTARERMLRAGKFPDVFPTTRRMLVDTENRVWVESFPVPNAPSVTWTVVDGSQRVIATLAVPNTFEVTDISSREVVGITVSADGIPLVQRFGIVRP